MAVSNGADMTDRKELIKTCRMFGVRLDLTNVPAVGLVAILRLIAEDRQDKVVDTKREPWEIVHVTGCQMNGECYC